MVPFYTGSEAIDLAEGFRFLLAPVASQAVAPLLIADGGAPLGTLDRAVGLPRTDVAERFVEIDDSAAILSGLGTLRYLPGGTSDYFVTVGKSEVGKAYLVRLRTHSRRYDFDTQFLGLFHIFVTAVQRVGKQFFWRQIS